MLSYPCPLEGSRPLVRPFESRTVWSNLRLERNRDGIFPECVSKQGIQERNLSFSNSNELFDLEV